MDTAISEARRLVLEARAIMDKMSEAHETARTHLRHAMEVLHATKAQLQKCESAAPVGGGAGIVDTRTGIQRAAERVCAATARFEVAVPVVETSYGRVTWQGTVSVFASGVGTVYAWATDGGQEPEFVAVLGLPPVDSPSLAIRAWLASSRF